MIIVVIIQAMMDHVSAMQTLRWGGCVHANEYICTLCTAGVYIHIYIYTYAHALILLQFTLTGLPRGIHGGRSHTIEAKRGSCRASLGPAYMPCSTRTFEYKMPLHNPKHS